MSNNKQIMKLYTEEQVRKAIKFTDECRDVDTSVENGIISVLTPIELPSDEEIDNYARQSGLVHPFVERGAKWMRDKIKGSNK